MARIRTVKPEFWSHPKVTAASRDARLLFLGMLNEADDAGRLRYIPKRLAGVVFPDDDDVDGQQIDRWCDELEQVGLVARYSIDGARLLQVIGFTEHQRINRPSESHLPPMLTDASVTAHDTLTESSLGEGKGREGKGSASEDAYVSEFDTLWSDYPRKEARKDALKAYQARRRAGVPHEELARSVPVFVNAMKREGRPRDKIMLGGTFFGPGERWKDFLEPFSDEVDPDELADSLSRGAA